MLGYTVLALAAKTATRASSRLRKAPISLTDAAADRVKSLLANRGKVGSLGLPMYTLSTAIREQPDYCGTGIPPARSEAKRVQWPCIYAQLRRHVLLESKPTRACLDSTLA